MNRLHHIAFRGFTLLEIMLVLVIMAVITAMVIPTLFISPVASLEDEGRYLRQLLTLAAEEAQLTGIPVRWTAGKTKYHFSSIDPEGEWQPMQQAPFISYTLAEDIRIQGIIQQGHVPGFDENLEKNEEGALGHIIFFPDGMLTLADISLSAGDAVLNIHVRPGAGGIQVEQ